MAKYNILYDTSLTYPGHQANKLQTMLMADGFSKICDTILLINKLKSSKNEILSNYGINDSKLTIRELWFLKYFSSLKNNHGNLYPFLKFIFKSKANNKKNILFVRRPNELVSWANAREKYDALRKWVFIYELHDFNEWHDSEFNSSSYDVNQFNHFKKTEKYFRFLKKFDLIITASKRLSIDLTKYNNKAINPILVEHANAMFSVKHSDNKISHLNKDIINIGYIGAIDSYRGFNTIIESLPHINSNIIFNFTGTVLKESFSEKIINILNEQVRIGKVLLKSHVPVNKLKYEVQNNDFMLISSSDDIVAKYYCSPLKYYDYLASGKEIISPSAPAYRDICDMNNISPHYYDHSDTSSFISCVNKLKKNNNQNTINKKIMNYKERAKKIIDLVDLL